MRTSGLTKFNSRVSISAEIIVVLGKEGWLVQDEGLLGYGSELVFRDGLGSLFKEARDSECIKGGHYSCTGRGAVAKNVLLSFPF